MAAQSSLEDRLQLLRAGSFEIVFGDQDTTVVSGDVLFAISGGTIACDSAFWLRGERAILMGNVAIEDSLYRLLADSVDYNLLTGIADATGDPVELWSRSDSLYAIGPYVWYHRSAEQFYMDERPTLYIGYPDTTTMTEVIANTFRFTSSTERGEANGDVVISNDQFRATAECAVFRSPEGLLDLYGEPELLRRRSVIRGSLISILSTDDDLRRIDVLDSAYGEFNEPINDTSLEMDRSQLSGDRIIFDFRNGDLTRVTCFGQAYSWYFPASRGSDERNQNSVSGDTIRLNVFQEDLESVEVEGGAIGTFIATRTEIVDSVPVDRADTVDYASQTIVYRIPDSTITLSRNASVVSGRFGLTAHEVEFDTEADVIEAFSADEIGRRRDTVDNPFISDYQPNAIPVVLRDGEQELFGDFLEYSLRTEKGRIVQSKTAYETGFFYGDKLYRESRDIYYLKDGRYTTCNLDEPHFHFYSTDLKLIEGDKLIARPVVFSLGRLPLFAIPYYVFPLQKGRRSGFTTFSLGNIERGERFVRNLGYYWAPSQYVDLQSAFDYFENGNTLNWYNRFRYKKLYTFEGSVEANLARQTTYSRTLAIEQPSTRWTFTGRHSHTLSPSLSFTANANFVSDATYYNDFSADLEDRLNRTLRSDFRIQKRFGRQTALSVTGIRDENLDTESLNLTLPSASLSLPTIKPFGSGTKDENGRLQQRWYNSIALRYQPSLINVANRSTIDEIDTLSNPGDTILVTDTSGVRSRREYTRIDQSVTASGRQTLLKYIDLVPSVSYSESWYRIYRTDQSETAGIEGDANYRTSSARFSVSSSTTLYGTVYPNLFGLSGIRQVLKPSVSYNYTPASNRNAEIAAFAGGTVGPERATQSLGISLSQDYLLRIGRDELARTLNLVTITSRTSYNFENDERPWGLISSSYNSNVLPNFRFYGSFTHDPYKPGTNELSFWSPYLLDFTFNTTLTLRGSRFLFDQPFDQEVASTVESEADGGLPGGSNWDLGATFTYRETGRHNGNFRKTSFLNVNLNFSLTPTTRIAYSQYYDLEADETVNSQVSITKQIHCWTGFFYWVPVGSNRGFGFRLNVTALPEIKLDNSQTPLRTDLLQSSR